MRFGIYGTVDKLFDRSSCTNSFTETGERPQPTQLHGSSTRSDRGPLGPTHLILSPQQINSPTDSRGDNIVRKETIVVHLKRCFDDKPRPLFFFFFFVLRCYSFENTQRIRDMKEIHINQIKFWLFHYKIVVI